VLLDVLGIAMAAAKTKLGVTVEQLLQQRLGDTGKFLGVLDLGSEDRLEDFLLTISIERRLYQKKI